MSPARKGGHYTCSKGCGATRSSWSAINAHENACDGKPATDRKAPDPKGPR